MTKKSSQTTLIMFLVLLQQIKIRFHYQSSAMDLFPNEQNFDLDKSRQKFHHSLKEHHKTSNIPKFRCKML